MARPLADIMTSSTPWYRPPASMQDVAAYQKSSVNVGMTHPPQNPLVRRELLQYLEQSGIVRSAPLSGEASPSSQARALPGIASSASSPSMAKQSSNSGLRAGLGGVQRPPAACEQVTAPEPSRRASVAWSSSVLKSLARHPKPKRNLASAAKYGHGLSLRRAADPRKRADSIDMANSAAMHFMASKLRERDRLQKMAERGRDTHDVAELLFWHNRAIRNQGNQK